MTTPATDIITRLIDYARHDDECSISRFGYEGDKCSCGYSAAIADAREFLEGLDKQIGEEDVVQEN